MSDLDDKLKAALDARLLTDAAKHWNTFIPTSSCCDKRIRQAMARGQLDTVETWTCAVCGCDWRWEMIEGVRVWSARPIVQIFR